MKFAGEAFEAALRQKRLAAGEAPRPTKRARKGDRAEPAQAKVAVAEKEPRTSSAGPAPAEGAGPSAPEGVVREEGEIPDTAPAAVVVLDEEEVPAVAKESEAGPVQKVAGSSAAAGPRTEEVTPGAKKRGVEEGSAAKAAAPKQRRGEAGRPARLSAPRPTPARAAEGGRDPLDRQLPRAAPRLSISRDVARAVELAMQTTTPETEAEMRQLSCSDILDTVMVSVVQMCHGALALRSAFLRSGEALASSTSRADKYKKECATLSQNLSKLQQEGRAREENLDSRAQKAESRATAAEAELRAATSREEGLTRRLKFAEEQAAMAKKEALANAERAVAAESAVVEAGHEKAGAVAYANEANARAEEAEARAGEAEARAKEAEARAKEAETWVKEAEAKVREVDARVAQAVGEFRSSSAFENEVLEASLHAYVEGFNVCKSKVAAVLKVADTDLEKIQAGDLGEALEEDEGTAEGAHGAAEAPGEAEDRNVAEGAGGAEDQVVAEPEQL